jgi:hypothetical protein
MSNRSQRRDVNQTEGSGSKARNSPNIANRQNPGSQTPRQGPYNPNDPNDPDVYKQEVIRRLRLLFWRTLLLQSIVACVTLVYLAVFYSETLVIDFVKTRIIEDLQGTGFWSIWSESFKVGSGMLTILLILVHIFVGAYALLEYVRDVHRRDR